MKTVHMLFYRPSPDDHWLNHVVSFLSPPYSHCDTQFEDGVATSIYQNEEVYMKQKQFSNLNYERLSVALTDDEYRRMRIFCERSHQNKVQFDLWGMAMSGVGADTPHDKTFCSRYVTEALMQTKRREFANMRPNRTTPSALYRTIVGSGRDFIHVGQNRLGML